MDTTAKARHPTPTCHSISPSPSELVPGISFEKLDGKWRFMPYALLSAVEFDGKDELKFHFASGPITVHGRNLGLIWKPIRTCQLERIWETKHPVALDGAWVSKLLFTELSTEADPNSLPFPSES